MEDVSPLLKNLLLAAVVIYVAGTTILISELFNKVGRLEYDMIHLTGKCTLKH